MSGSRFNIGKLEAPEEPSCRKERKHQKDAPRILQHPGLESGCLAYKYRYPNHVQGAPEQQLSWQGRQRAGEGDLPVSQQHRFSQDERQCQDECRMQNPDSLPVEPRVDNKGRHHYQRDHRTQNQHPGNRVQRTRSGAGDPKRCTTQTATRKCARPRGERRGGRSTGAAR